MRNPKEKKKGFTLIELIIVIAIIGILASIAVPKYGGIQQTAKKQADVTNAKVIGNACSILVAQNTITENVNASLDVKAGVSTDDKKFAITLLTYLQTIPTQQVSGLLGEPFYVEVDVATGEIKVYTDIDQDIELYPIVNADYVN